MCKVEGTEDRLEYRKKEKNDDEWKIKREKKNETRRVNRQITSSRYKIEKHEKKNKNKGEQKSERDWDEKYVISRMEKPFKP